MRQLFWLIIPIGVAVSNANAKVEVYTVSTIQNHVFCHQLILDNSLHLVVVNWEPFYDSKSYYAALRKIVKKAKTSRSNIVCHITTATSNTDELEKYLIQELYAEGVIVVACVGNDSIITRKYPAALKEVLAVGAYNVNQYLPHDYIAFYDNGLAKSDIPQISNATKPNSISVASVKESSFASARIAGLLAYIWYRNENWSSTDVISFLKSRRNNQLRIKRTRIIGDLTPEYHSYVERYHKTVILCAIPICILSCFVCLHPIGIVLGLVITIILFAWPALAWTIPEVIEKEASNKLPIYCVIGLFVWAVIMVKAKKQADEEEIIRRKRIESQLQKSAQDELSGN